MKKDEFSKIELLIGNSSRKFSGGTSIMLQLLDYQEKLKPLVVIGKHYVPEHIRSISFFNFLKSLVLKPQMESQEFFMPEETMK